MGIAASDIEALDTAPVDVTVFDETLFDVADAAGMIAVADGEAVAGSGAWKRRSRLALVTTERLDAAMAAAAIIGLKRHPKIG